MIREYPDSDNLKYHIEDSAGKGLQGTGGNKGTVAVKSEIE